MKKQILFLVFILLGSSPTFAQLGIEEGAKSIWDEIKSAAPYILAVIFLISVLVNSGKLIGENRDYMAFVRGLALWFGMLLLIGGMISYILSLSF